MVSDVESYITPEGCTYHLNMRPEDLADTVILVGDPGRVPKVSQHFDRMDIETCNRELVSHTGWVGAKRITVVSTGMGTGSVDIVLNELDVLANMDFATRTEKKQKRVLSLIRVGTAGGFQADLSNDAWVVSDYALGLDNVLHYYPRVLSAEETSLENAFSTLWAEVLPGVKPYAVAADAAWCAAFGKRCHRGLDISAPGFYAPQGRALRGGLRVPDFVSRVSGFVWEGKRIVSCEMETSALYGLARVLGHRAISLSAIVFNRVRHAVNENYQRSVQELIEHVIDVVVA